ncbi:MAG TPA: hypothetical protein VHR47_09895, partial [Bacillota bacterium]|nr:hypothetical protein [Bacillota bacterium]
MLKKYGRIVLIIPLILLLCVMLQSPSSAATKRRVIVLTLDRFTLNELVASRLPHLRKMMAHSTLGLLSLKSVGQPNPGKTYASIGAGGVIPGDPIVTQAYDPDEAFGGITAGKAYQNLNGFRSHQGPVHLGLPKLQKDAEEEYAYRAGELGRLLHGYGLKTAVFGNCDTKDEIDRSGVALLMD